MRRRIGIAAVLVAVLAVAASAAAATALVPVLVKGKPNPVWETTPAASGSFLAWSQNSAAHPNVFNEYAQGIAGGPIVRVNTLNSTADGGGIDGNRLVYQQIIKGQSDIRYFNWRSTRTRTRRRGSTRPSTNGCPRSAGTGCCSAGRAAAPTGCSCSTSPPDRSGC